MAAPQMGKGPPKPTFAKVAAMAPTRQAKPQSQPPPVHSGSSISSLEATDQSSTTNTSLSSAPPQRYSIVQARKSSFKAPIEKRAQAADVDTLTRATQTLQVEAGRSVSARETGDRLPGTQNYDVPDGESERPAIQPPASEISTKPSSVDGRSAISGVTFGFDEKESLRPDDSASVKAADDEDADAGPDADALGSHQGSRAGEAQQLERVASNSQHLQQEDVDSRFGGSVQQLPPSMAVDPISDTQVVCPPVLASAVTLNGSVVPYGFSLEPDPKLVEALEDPRDRLFVLRLEQDVIEFVKDSKEPFMELPPCNSFCRLLIHKLADYYFLTHFVDTKINSVRVYRTPFCRLPPPLTGISNPPTSGHTPPPTGPAVRIMRRDAPDDGKPKRSFDGSAAESDERSRAGSVVSGVDAHGNRHGDAKERGNLTREEREVKYREARERIFKGFEETEVDEPRAGWNEPSKHTSRSSSRTGRSRNAGRRHRNAHDHNNDGFEARSQFAPYYPAMQPGFHSYPGMSPYGGQGMPPPGSGAHDLGGNAIAAFQPPSPAAISQHLRPYASGAIMSPPQMYSDVGGFDSLGRPYSRAQVSPDVSAHSSASGSGYSTGDYNFPLPFNPAAPGGFPANLRQPPYPSTPMGNTPWPAVAASMPHPYPTFDGPNANLHQGTVDPYHTPAAPMGMPPSYPYGQLPNQAPQHAGFRINYQHPLPGSFNRHALNPQIQPFVPGQRAHAGPPSQYSVPGAQPGGGGGGGGQTPYQKTRSLQPTTFDPSPHAPPPAHHRIGSSVTSNHSSRTTNNRSFSPALHGSTGSMSIHPTAKPENRPLTTEPPPPPRWGYPANHHLPAKPPVPASASHRSANQPRHAGTPMLNGSPAALVPGPGMHGPSPAPR